MLENVPDWPGLLEQRGSLLLMSDARLRLDAGPAGETHLVPLEELYFAAEGLPRRVSDQIGSVLQTLALGAAEKEDYPQAHHHLERLRALYPENPQVGCEYLERTGTARPGDAGQSRRGLQGRTLCRRPRPR
jgi:hypothetical protein